MGMEKLRPMHRNPSIPDWRNARTDENRATSVLTILLKEGPVRVYAMALGYAGTHQEQLTPLRLINLHVVKDVPLIGNAIVPAAYAIQYPVG